LIEIQNNLQRNTQKLLTKGYLKSKVTDAAPTLTKNNTMTRNDAEDAFSCFTLKVCSFSKNYKQTNYICLTLTSSEFGVEKEQTFIFFSDK